MTAARELMAICGSRALLIFVELRFWNYMDDAVIVRLIERWWGGWEVPS